MMNWNISEFQKLFNTTKNFIVYSHIKSIIQHFKCYLIKDNDFNVEEKLEFTTKEGEPNIAVIGKIGESEDQYLIVIYDQIIFFISKSMISYFNVLLNKLKGASIITLSDSMDNFLEENIQKQIKKFNNSEKYLSAIKSFSENLKSTPIRGKEIGRIWYLIIPFLSTYFISKSYEKLQIERNNFKTKQKIVKLNKDNYISLLTIGKGSSSSVELIYHIEMEELFALKKFESKGNEKSFQREKNFYKNFYSNFPRFYGEAKIDNINCIIIEFMPYKTLYHVNYDKFSKIEKYFIVLQIMLIVEFFQFQKFIFRDLKPDNILIDENNNIFFIDFDQIRNSNEIKEDSIITQDFNSPFVCPELQGGDIKEYTFKEDIYSIGCLMEYIFFEKKDKSSRYHKYKNIKKIIQECKKTNPKNRPIISSLINNFFDYIIGKDIVNLPKWIQIDNDHQMNSDDLKHRKYFFNERINFYPSEYLLQHIDLFIDYLIYLSSEKYEIKKYIFNFMFSKVLFLTDDLSITIQILKNVAYQNNNPECYELLENLNDSNELICIGNLYANGFGVEQNFIKAKDYYELASKENDSEAFVKLGNLYQNGQGVEQDYLIAKEYYELAAKQNNSNALNNLGHLYEQGLAVTQDFNKAKEYYELSSQQDNPNAFFNLGYIYEEGIGVEQDYLKAKRYYELAAENNKNSTAYIRLGLLYENGNGVNKDFIKAKEYYKIAAKQNNSGAYLYIGNLYEEGLGVNQNFLKAKKYYELAAEKKNPDSFISLGNLYEDGLGVKQDYQKARKYYEIAIKNNNYDAYNFLANIYYKGLGVKKDYKKAIEFFELAASKNNLEALNNLAVFYMEGIGVDQNVIKAKEYLELAAKNGDIDSLYNLGSLYLNYIVDSKQDYQKAREYFELAAEKKHIDSFNNLGYIYSNGLGVDKNYIKAKEYYELSAKENDPDGLFYLGEFYLKGDGVEQDYKKSIEYFELSAIQGNYNGLKMLKKLYKKGIITKNDYIRIHKKYELSINQLDSDIIVNIGNDYANGKYVEQDYMKAKEYFELASKQNDIHAFYNLALMYEQGLGINQDYMKAKEYYEIACQQNDPDSLINLGNMYENGLGIKQDYNKARELYEIAAKQNNSIAFFNLGYFYENGLGVVKDYLRAKYYYKISAKQKESQSLLNLGNLYLKGFGVKHNLSKAKKYIKLSAKQNNHEALVSLGNLYEKGIGVKQSYLKAKKNYELATQQLNSDGFLNLGKLYENGFGVKQDFNKAIQYYQLSSSQNNPNAFFYLGDIFSNGEIIETDIQKAIQYYTKCTEIQNKNISILHFSNNHVTYQFIFNKFRYPSYNNIGLIHLIISQDIQKAEKFLKEAALNEYPFGQNNFGLLCQFYLNNIEYAEYMYQRSSEHDFAVANYNLGYFYEINGKIDKSIEFYSKASVNEDKPLFFQGFEYNDKRLNISKIFVICLTNLKLSHYYFSIENYSKSKYYFNKTFSKLYQKSNDSVYQFKFEIKGDVKINIFSYLKSFIFNFPLFNLINQKHLNAEIKLILTDLSTQNSEFIVPMNENDINLKKKKNKLSNPKNDVLILNRNIFDNPGKLFNFIMQNSDLKNIFLREINEIIELMKKVLYFPPYDILFGRINIEKELSKSKKQGNYQQQNIDQTFYQGFDIEES